MSDITFKKKPSPYDGLGECWECDSHKPDDKGYPRHFVDGKAKRIYRTVYELNHGPIPKGLVVRHKCDNRLCINPAHLELGTTKDNAMDREMRGRNKSPLSIDDVIAIREADKSNKELAVMFGVAAVTIWQIRTKRRYAWL
jgi:hypothetical protein